MTRIASSAAVLAFALAGTVTAQQKKTRVPVTVVDLADGRAFIEPGALKDLRPGDDVFVGNRKYRVAAVSESFAVIDASERPVDVGSRGVAIVEPNRALEEVAPLPKPQPLAAYRDAWSPAQAPAATQKPKAVPLGRVRARGANQLSVSVAALGVIPLDDAGGGYTRGEARARLHYQTTTSTPLTLDLDAAVQGFLPASLSERPGADSRPLVRVRELLAGYGSQTSFRGALGRMRYASAVLGNVDGVRLEAPITDAGRLSAFGGTVPHPFSGAPSTDSGRAGMELEWHERLAAWQPRAVIGAHVSRFEGSLDERKVYAMFDLLPSFGRFGAHGELDFYDSDNPWNAPATQLTAAGADVAIEEGIFFAGGRFEMRRPDRSRFLASFLPMEWLCRPSDPTGAISACSGSNMAYWATLDTGLRFEKASVTVGGQGTYTEDVDADNLGAFTNFRLLDFVGPLRLDGGAFFANGSLIRTVAGTLSPGLGLMDGDLDLSARYRLGSTKYRVDSDPFFEHTVGGSVWLSPVRALDWTLDGDVILGPDVNAVVFQTVVTWRPEI